MSYSSTCEASATEKDVRTLYDSRPADGKGEAAVTLGAVGSLRDLEGVLKSFWEWRGPKVTMKLHHLTWLDITRLDQTVVGQLSSTVVVVCRQVLRGAWAVVIRDCIFSRESLKGAWAVSVRVESYIVILWPKAESFEFWYTWATVLYCTCVKCRDWFR